MDLSRQVSDLLVPSVDLGSNSLDLLRDFNALLCLVCVLVLEHLELILATVDDAVLALDLRFEVALQNCNALLVGISSSLQVLDLGPQGGEVPLTELVRLNLSPISCNDPLTNVLADLRDLELLLVLLLDLLVLHVLSLLSLLSVLLVVAKGGSVPGDVHDWVRRRDRQAMSWWRVGPHW